MLDSVNEQIFPPREADLLRSQYRALLEISESIAAHRDLNELFYDLAQRLPSIVPFDFINLVLHDPARDVMRLHTLVAPESSTIRTGMELPVDQAPAGSVWKSQQSLMIEVHEATVETRFPKLTLLLRENDVRSYCVVPLTTAMRRLGAMGFGSTHRRFYEETEIKFMEHVAKQVAVGVDNVLHDESARSAQRQLTHERDRVRLLLEVNNAVVSHLSLDDLFPAVSACLRKVIQHDGSALVLYDSDTRRYRVHVLSFAKNESFIEEGIADSDCRTPARMAMTSRKPVVLGEGDLQTMAAESQCAKYWLAEGMRGFCSAPLLLHDRVLGGLDIGRRYEDTFSPDEVDLLGEIAKQIAIAVENAQAYRQISELKERLAKENIYLEEEVRTDHNFGEIVGDSAALRRVLKEVETVAPTGSTVLIQGETGTGKELIARALHDLSPRRDRTFVKLNCAAIPTGLLESELFGHEKGAFTGAITQKIGRFELAHQGTLFLDEVGDIPPELQPKLLRALQEQEFERLGSARTLRVDVRVVAATNRDLAEMVADGGFRSDLYYRLNVFPVVLPPLRERRDDIPMLVRHFTQRFARRMGRPIESIPAAVMDALIRYPWPGNIREMQNVIERAVILCRGPELEIPVSEFKQQTKAASADFSSSLPTLEETERKHILRALGETNWIIGGSAGAAFKLGMKRTTLQSKMRKLGIERPQ
jgi:formate hydrogenlyase transcriptional activator